MLIKYLKKQTLFTIFKKGIRYLSKSKLKIKSKNIKIEMQ